jgi:hypothetical protein
MRHKSLPRAQKGKIVKNLFKKTVNISDDEISKGIEMAERARLKERFKAIDKADKGVKSNLIPKKKMGGMYLNGGDTTKTKPLYPQAVPSRTPTKRPNIPKPNITKPVDNYIRNPRPDKAPSIKKMGGSYKKGGSFPDLTGDGKVTRADVLKGRGVFKKGGSAHPGFKAVQSSIAKKQGVSKKSAGAILAASTRKASAAAKRANPNLKRVKG